MSTCAWSEDTTTVYYDEKSTTTTSLRLVMQPVVSNFFFTVIGAIQRNPSWLTRREWLGCLGWRNVVMPRPPGQRQQYTGRVQASGTMSRAVATWRLLVGPSLKERAAKKRRAWLHGLV